MNGSFTDDSYAKETHSSLKNQIPVQKDNERLEDPIEPPYSNSDQQLGKSKLTNIAVITKLT